MFNTFRQLLDLLLVLAGAAIAYSLAPDSDPGLLDARSLFVALDIALVVLMFPLFDVYRSWRGKSALTLTVPAVLAWLLAQGTGIVIYAALHRASALPHAWLTSWTLITVALLAASRQLIVALLGRLRSAGYNQKRVAIVGNCDEARRLIQRIDSAPYAGYAVVAVYDESAPCDGPLAGVPVVSGWNELTQTIRENGVRELWLTGRPSQPHPCERFIGEFRHDFVNIRLLPDLDNLALANLGTVDVLGLPAINLVDSPVSALRRIPKEIFDRAFAAVTLIALAPLFAIVACAVKLSSPGPVFFKQKRKGVDGNEFVIYKFRSMRMHTDEAGKITQATKHDKRVTAVGRFLRRTSIDELPQFINVLKGEMSVVGPRPHAVEHDEYYKDLVQNYMYRYRIKPGITGWAQVNGLRGETDRVEKMADRVACDLYYMLNWSFWFDVKIVLMTLSRGLVSPNAY